MICETCKGKGYVMAYDPQGDPDRELCEECLGTGHPPAIGHPAAREIARLRWEVEALRFDLAGLTPVVEAVGRLAGLGPRPEKFPFEHEKAGREAIEAYWRWETRA